MFVRRIPPQIQLADTKALTRSSIDPARNRNRAENLQDLALYSRTPPTHPLYQINSDDLESTSWRLDGRWSMEQEEEVLHEVLYEVLHEVLHEGWLHKEGAHGLCSNHDDEEIKVDLRLHEDDSEILRYRHKWKATRPCSILFSCRLPSSWQVMHIWVR